MIAKIAIGLGLLLFGLWALVIITYMDETRRK